MNPSGRWTFLDATDPEIQRAWRCFLDPVMEHCGERVQYMGSEEQPGGRWAHSFRHRQAPWDNEQHDWLIDAPTDWQPVVRQ